MASTKKRRKEARRAHDGRLGNQARLCKDGDRRRRGGPSAKQAIAHKKLLQESPLLFFVEPNAPIKSAAEPEDA